ncbi:hypothetical protein [Citricoccus alkalitolerans]|uniref:EcsC family protein n=1 Tax=Citricoccus alkalitolerans TaxID=246603 RepID=A0ABV8XTH8_9MICC
MALEFQRNEPPAERTVTDDEDLILDAETPQSEKGSADEFPGMVREQDKEAEEFAIEFLKKVLRLRGVRIDREKYLRAELHRRGESTARIDQAITENPAAAGIPTVMLDEIAKSAIDFETKKSTGMSFAAGLPGGFAMLGTVPADITQFYVHAFRIMQKVAYIYGWQSFLRDTEDIDDETLGKLAAFLGVMMGVAGASTSVTAFAAQVARPAIQKKITSVALTKTSWFLPMKQTMKLIGIQVTKKSFANAATKVVPVVGGVISGSLTFVTLNAQAKRLMNHLREIPPPNVDAAEYLAAMRGADEEAVQSTTDRGHALGIAVSNAADLFRSVDRDGDGVPYESRAGQAVKGAASALRDGAAGAAGKMGSLVRRKKSHQASTDSPGDDLKSPDADEPLVKDSQKNGGVE